MLSKIVVAVWTLLSSLAAHWLSTIDLAPCRESRPAVMSGRSRVFSTSVSAFSEASLIDLSESYWSISTIAWQAGVVVASAALPTSALAEPEPKKKNVGPESVSIDLISDTSGTSLCAPVQPPLPTTGSSWSLKPSANGSTTYVTSDLLSADAPSTPLIRWQNMPREKSLEHEAAGAKAVSASTGNSASAGSSSNTTCCSPLKFICFVSQGSTCSK